MDWLQYFNSDKNKRTLLIGVCLLLLGAITGVSLILQMQFSARLNQIEKASLVNSQRLDAIANFLNQVDQQIQARKQKDSFKSLVSDLSGAEETPQE